MMPDGFARCGCGPAFKRRVGLGDGRVEWMWTCKHGSTQFDLPAEPGRMATCYVCKKEAPSHPQMAGITRTPTRATDTYYCGCRGF